MANPGGFTFTTSPPPLFPPQPPQQGSPFTFGAPPPQHFTFGSPSATTPPTPIPQRKRRASGDDPTPSWSPGPEMKRRRPNLQTGFKAMSITPSGQTTPSWPSDRDHYDPARSPSVNDEGDDELLEPTGPPADGDVAVELLPDHSPTQRRSRPPWHRTSSFSSTSPSEEEYDSDMTFHLPHVRARVPVHPSAVEHPPEEGESDATTPTAIHARAMRNQQTPGVVVEELDTPSKRRKRHSDDDHRAKRSRSSFDAPMDTDSEMDAALSRGRGWYEPEKDRIVVTDLDPSPSPTSSRGSSRRGSVEEPRSPSSRARLDDDPPEYTYDTQRHLAQPGATGFTLSPSLLTHLMNSQRESLGGAGYRAGKAAERGLVLYRPLGGVPAHDVVREWRGAVPMDDDRFEELDDDEDFTAPGDEGMGAGMDVDDGGDVAMDCE